MAARKHGGHNPGKHHHGARNRKQISGPIIKKAGQGSQELQRKGPSVKEATKHF